MAAGILGLCRSLGVVAIAEGVERQTQADCLADLGFTLMQGYHFGHPDPELRTALDAASLQMPEELASLNNAILLRSEIQDAY